MIWLTVIVGLLLLVFIHELGHFTVSLLVGMRPRAFYVGFPPAIAKVKHKGIEYAIGAIPLGGYVRIPGMHRPAGADVEAFMSPALHEQPSLAPLTQQVRRKLDADDLDGARLLLPELRTDVEAATLTRSARRSANRAVRELDEGTGSDAYWRQPTWKRVAAIAAGPAANILVAFIIFTVVYATGAPSSTPSTEVAAVSSKTPAAAAGLHRGDRVVAVDGRSAKTFDQVSRLIRSSHGRAITVTVDRGGKDITLGPRKTIKLDGRWIWGFEPATKLVSYPLGHSAGLAASDCWQVVTGTVKAFGSLFHRHQQAQLTSTVGIVRISAAALQVGFNYYLQIVGLVSMSLALLNLLPLLPLDGGHILFSIIEAFRRRALAREVYERVSVVGFALIILIWVIALQHDLGGNAPG
ncbi:MAG TPA: M50 family metallopeptidase [Gaiellaceae bacterium]|nr:M50 family metallopeptidase [Gaiellaceae bacterium]